MSRERPLYEKGVRKTLMQILLNEGIVMRSALHFLPINHRTATKKLTDMENEGIVRVVRIEGQKGWVLADFNNKSSEYLKYYDDRENGKFYYGYYNDHGSKRVEKIRTGSYADKIRLKNSAELFPFLVSTGVNCLYTNKPSSILNETLPNDFTSSYYYSSVEVKERYVEGAERDVENGGVKINGGKEVINDRMHGLLITPDENYIVYSYKKKPFEWQTVAQEKARIITGKRVTELCPSAYEGRYKISTAMVFSESAESLFELLNLNTKHGLKNSRLISNSGYKSVLGLPMTPEGQKHLQNIIKKGWMRSTTDSDVAEGWTDGSKEIGMRCDGFKITDGKKEYLIDFRIPDLMKLWGAMITTFASSSNSNKITIYCYKYQEAMLANLFNGSAVHIVSKGDII